MGYVNYFLLTQKRSYFGCLTLGTSSVGVILAVYANRLVLLCRQSPRVPTESRLCRKTPDRTDTVEMSRLIKGMDPEKGPGYDNIPPKLLKLAPEELSVPLTALFNESLKKMCFPSDLKMSELAPLFKNKDSLLFGNYRPVSILPCTSKLFEKIYHDQLYDYFNELLSSLQNISVVNMYYSNWLKIASWL